MFPEMIDQPAVHRLDMFTSGIMVFAKTAAAQRSLSIQFAKRVVHKTYHAMVEGRLPGEGGEDTVENEDGEGHRHEDATQRDHLDRGG